MAIFCGIFINSNGGYFGYNTNLEVTDTQEISKYKLPTEEIRIISWPNGKHFYAKIGNADVVVDGRQKWDTKAEAQLNAEKFLKES
jgi:hypothetical protein